MSVVILVLVWFFVRPGWWTRSGDGVGCGARVGMMQ
jgi:hypothetical protein